MYLAGATREGEEPFTRIGAAQPGHRGQLEQVAVKPTLVPNRLSIETSIYKITSEWERNRISIYYLIGIASESGRALACV